MIVLSTGSLYTRDICTVFELSAEAGYDGVEVMVDGRWDSRDPGYLKRLSGEFGQPIAALHSPFVAEVQGWPRDPLRRLQQTIALAQELGVGLVAAHLPLRLCGVEGRFGERGFFLPIPWLQKDSYYRFLREGKLKEMEASTGVTVALENMPARRFFGWPINAFWFNTPAQFSQFAHLTLDTTHLATWSMDPVAVYQRLKDHIRHVHLSNHDGREHRSPTIGHLHLSELLRAMNAAKYAGAVTVEVDPEALDPGDLNQCRRELRSILRFCRSHFAAGA